MLKTVWLSGEQIAGLAAIVAEQGWTPIPSKAVVLAAFDEEGLAGFHVLQMRAHVEPLYVRPSLRGTGLAMQLSGEMKQFLEDTGTGSYIVIADSPVAVRLCDMHGMKRIPSPVYIK